MRDIFQTIGIVVAFVLICWAAIEFGIPAYGRYMNRMGISSDCILSNDPWMCEQVKGLHR